MVNDQLIIVKNELLVKKRILSSLNGAYNMHNLCSTYSLQNNHILTVPYLYFESIFLYLQKEITGKTKTLNLNWFISDTTYI